MQEQVITIEKFKNSFKNQKKKKIVLYGTGINAEAIVKNTEDFNIIGLMDAAKTGNILWNLPVFSYEEILENQVDFIVIVARPAVLSIIYNRIREFVEEKQIPVYDIEGNLVKEFCEKKEKEHPYFQISEQDLVDKINKHDVISFDIFDTLLMRKVLFPNDVFEIVKKRLDSKYEFDYVIERKEAERELIRKGVNPTIEDIYSNLSRKCNLSEVEKKELLVLEIEIEQKVLIPRKKMQELFFLCKKLGKEIYIVSDMYLTRKYLEKILEQFDFNGYEDIIISCEYGISKEEGLFSVLKERIGDKSCIHIGDNLKADIEAPLKQKIETSYIMSAREMLENSVQEALLSNILDLEKRILLGIYISEIYNNPFCMFGTKGKPVLDRDISIGYSFIAPILYGFVNWMSQELEKQKVDYILFGARDGYLMQKLYLLYCERMNLPPIPNAYILISRRNIAMCALENEEDILEMVQTYEGDISRVAFNLFGIEVLENDNIVKKEDILRYEDVIKQCAQKEKRRYLAYLQEFLVGSNSKIAFFDFMSKGTCHQKLEKVLGRKLLGVYFQKSNTKDKAKNNLDYVSLCKATSAFEKNYAIFKYCDFLETIVTDFNASFWGFDGEGKECFYSEKRTKDELELLKEFHQDILRYAKDMLEIYPYSTDVEFDFYDQLLKMIEPEFSKMDNELSMLKMYDGYSDKMINVGELFK